jgi:hypothetical protein
MTDAGDVSAGGAGADGGATLPRDFPPVVYLPCTESVQDPLQATVQMRRARDGRVAVLAYSALDRLHDACGDEQPWVLLPTTSLDALQQARPFQLLLMDVVIPPEHRYAGPGGVGSPTIVTS